jgi:hypothetical protein
VKRTQQNTLVKILSFAINCLQLKLSFVSIIFSNNGCKQHILITNDSLSYKRLVANNSFSTSDNRIYEMIISYESQKWILNYHNILDFWNVKNLHYNPYHMIMDSRYLLKCLVKWFFYMESSVMPLIQRRKILKDFENHKLIYTMKCAFF